MKPPDRLILEILAALAVGALVLIPLTLRRPLGSLKTAGPDHFFAQSEDFTCGPAALVSAESWCGRSVTERAMVEACGTTQEGTTAEQIAKACGGWVQPMPKSVGMVGRTFVVEINDEPPLFHFVCAHAEAGGWEVDDPDAKGPALWKDSDFSTAIAAVEVR